MSLLNWEEHTFKLLTGQAHDIQYIYIIYYIACLYLIFNSTSCIIKFEINKKIRITECVCDFFLLLSYHLEVGIIKSGGSLAKKN